MPSGCSFYFTSCLHKDNSSKHKVSFIAGRDVLKTEPYLLMLEIVKVSCGWLSCVNVSQYFQVSSDLDVVILEEPN